MTRRRKHWGWGYEDEALTGDALAGAASFLAERFGFGPPEVEAPVALEQVTLPALRVGVPAQLRSICALDVHSRARHALGSSYRDVVRGFRGRFAHVPDFVARPRAEDDVEAVLEWAAAADVAVVPYGGGTSVVGGVEPDVGSRYAGVISLDLRGLDRVLEIDRTSLAARIAAGATGPVLEEQLAASGLTLRHFPQSFQFSTLGGWIATRAAGHFATHTTHIDDLVESVRAITPVGAWQSRRLPGSGAGPSPDRLLLGSEGTLGVITEAWVRVRPRPVHRASATVRFPTFAAGADAVRAIVQSGLQPANLRLVDPHEAELTGAGDGAAAILLLAFESAQLDVQPQMTAALQATAAHGGQWERRDRTGAGGDDARVSWRDAFLRAPYLRDTLVAIGVLSETFETAITWDRFPAFHAAVTARTTEAVRDVCGAGSVTCRLTHVYPDGPAPYFTVLARGRRGEEVAQWDAIKRVAADTVLAEGGTITHHHAVGRDHRPWYDSQRPEPFATALRAAKGAVDPGALLNPGVVIDPR